MLQPDAFCEHTMQQNATAAGAPPWTPLGSLQRSSWPLIGFKGAASQRGGEWEGREGEERGGEGEVDSDAPLEQGRRLAKAGPECMCVNFTNLQRMLSVSQTSQAVDRCLSTTDILNIQCSVMLIIIVTTAAWLGLFKNVRRVFLFLQKMDRKISLISYLLATPPLFRPNFRGVPFGLLGLQGAKTLSPHPCN